MRPCQVGAKCCGQADACMLSIGSSCSACIPCDGSTFFPLHIGLPPLCPTSAQPACLLPANDAEESGPKVPSKLAGKAKGKKGGRR